MKPPYRMCTGNPDDADFGFCGTAAVYVARGEDGPPFCERFSCEVHVGTWEPIPIAEWFVAAGQQWEADEARDRIYTMELEGRR